MDSLISSISSVIMQLEQSNVNATPLSSANGPSDILTEDVLDSHGNNVLHLKPSYWTKVKAANRRILPETSKGEIKLLDIVHELQRYAVVEEVVIRKEDQTPKKNPCSYIRLFQHRLTQIIQKPTFHYIVILLVVTDLIVVFVDLVIGTVN